ncbi:NitT/TauT family transport system permease protein [Thermosporothrix hazakensis]|jgi:NitT/TauT family transport system permease protein|uniref:NitT/TauT family transport system permease protein n=2 Tax=Thermosporothrix TaxID=768650 RepID=A0A326UCR0_THEHA|nr:ABC transporter permease [Thermosporothrix hazakensis]PZW32069.1 NitT/TauT family transport system permease protein [Thermosporothrix hazakensis]BBH91458.1 riboflavin transport system permease protein RibX [Thermosporothrix sp. COM3]GCE49603.1 riboflavin transport system permease protein RibX [Thermosporothrix hazakensis]
MSVISPIKDEALLEQQPHGMTSAARMRHQRARQHARTANILLSVVPPLVLALLLFLGWYLGTNQGQINALFLPAPQDVFTALNDGIASGLYLNNVLVTVKESLLGFVLALVIAIPLGYGLAKSRLLAAAIHPYLAAGQAIPAIVIAPLLVLWLGYGWIPNMYVCALTVLFPMVVNTVLGIQTIEKPLIDAARVEGASGWTMFAHIEFPLALPSIVAGIRTGLTLSVVGALVGEFVQGGDQGLGSLLLVAKNQYNTAFMFATLLVLVVLAVAYYGSTWLLGKLAKIIY